VAETVSARPKIQKPDPKTPVEQLTTAWEPGERNVKTLARSELLTVLLHTWPTGGEVGLHHHTDGDATWIVQEGEVTFWDENDQVLAKAGPSEAVLVPRYTAYWFENSGEGTLRMFRVSARVGGGNNLNDAERKDDRVYHKRG
jgi:mannose-6-phosphate isomerase-like protein (cupin superfamily)